MAKPDTSEGSTNHPGRNSRPILLVSLIAAGGLLAVSGLAFYGVLWSTKSLGPKHTAQLRVQPVGNQGGAVTIGLQPSIRIDIPGQKVAVSFNEFLANLGSREYRIKLEFRGRALNADYWNVHIKPDNRGWETVKVCVPRTTGVIWRDDRNEFVIKNESVL